MNEGGSNRFPVELTAVVIAVRAGTPCVRVVTPASGRDGNGGHATAPGGERISERGNGGATDAPTLPLAGPALPSGPLQSADRSLQAGLRGWVEEQTGQSLGFVEQLYTFADRPFSEPFSASTLNHARDDRFADPPREDVMSGNGAGGDREIDRRDTPRSISIAYLALVRDAGRAGPDETAASATWADLYDFFPWEDRDGVRPGGGVPTARRGGSPRVPAPGIARGLARWIAGGATAGERAKRRERVRFVGGCGASRWDEERPLERYELLYEAGLCAEALRDRSLEPTAGAPDTGRAMAGDHRRILATALGRIRAKIKYRPVLFELMPARFTLNELQRTAEALSGVRLHKQNFRRLVTQQGLVEETDETRSETGGRPARLMRFRPNAAFERSAPGVRFGSAR